MRILVAGSSGLIGTALVRRLRGSGHEVRTLVRRDTAGPGEYRWDPPAGHIAAGACDGVDAVVNLCGASLANGRWSHARKQVLTDSRTEPTEVLAAAVAERGIPTLVNASAVGYYGDTGAAEVDESAGPGTGFLARLCTLWEGATEPARAAGAQVVTLRTGLVLARGGLLARLRPLFALGLGGRIGDGTQYMPWIALPDHLGAVEFLLGDGGVAGPVNVTAPDPVTNAEFTRVLAGVLGRPAPWRVSAAALHAVLGEFADDALLAGQRAVPEVLRRAGFAFRHPDLSEALTATLRPAESVG